MSFLAKTISSVLWRFSGANQRETLTTQYSVKTLLGPKQTWLWRFQNKWKLQVLKKYAKTLGLSNKQITYTNTADFKVASSRRLPSFLVLAYQSLNVGCFHTWSGILRSAPSRILKQSQKAVYIWNEPNFITKRMWVEREKKNSPVWNDPTTHKLRLWLTFKNSQC